MQLKALVVFWVVLSAGPVFGQSSAVIIGGGYTAPAPLVVAPGQVITIFVNGIGSGITQSVAAGSYPLPATLGGISVSLFQNGIQSPSVPLLAVFPFNACTNFPQCSNFLGVTLQVPFELVPYVAGPIGPPCECVDITVSDGVNTAKAIQLTPVSDQIHVLRYGDTIMGTNGSFSGPIVTHADGSLVSPESPAKVGEVLVAYAVGLGLTDPRVKTGAASPLPVAGSSIQLPLIFDYRLNATPSGALINPQASGQQGPLIQATSIFAGLAPGYAGLYQVNFLVPAPPGPLPACGGTIISNLTVNLIGSTGFPQWPSFDGAAICDGVQRLSVTLDRPEHLDPCGLKTTPPHGPTDVPFTLEVPHANESHHFSSRH